MKAWAGLYRWLDGVKLHPQPAGYSRQYYSTEYYRGESLAAIAPTGEQPSHCQARSPSLN